MIKNGLLFSSFLFYLYTPTPISSLMKLSLMIALSLGIRVQSYAIFIQVDLITKDHDDLEYRTSLEILDSLGKQLAFSENQGARLSAHINDELRGKISIKVRALGYFPVILK
jgi:hypothetical protein